MPLRKVDSGVYVTEEGQFVISLAKSGRRAFLVPDTAAEWYVTTYGRIRALTAVLLALACAGAALNLFSAIWVLSAVAGSGPWSPAPPFWPLLSNSSSTGVPATLMNTIGRRLR